MIAFTAEKRCIDIEAQRFNGNEVNLNKFPHWKSEQYRDSSMQWQEWVKTNISLMII